MKKQYNYKNKKESGKNETGRPTLYKPEYCQGIIDYFINAPKTEQILKSRTIKDGVVQEYYETIGSGLPTIIKYARKINVNASTIYQWAKDYPEFSNALACVSDLYKDFINDNALSGHYNPIYAKFVAINTTDMKDKQETDLNLKTFEHYKKEIEKFAEQAK